LNKEAILLITGVRALGVLGVLEAVLTVAVAATMGVVGVGAGIVIVSDEEISIVRFKTD